MPSPDLISLFVLPLNQLDIPYMVTGAMATIAYSAPRLTSDIDLVVELKVSDGQRLTSAFPPEEFYLPPLEIIREDARRQRYGLNIIHTESVLRADIYVMGDDPLHAWGFPKRHSELVGGEPVWFAPIEYVITRKLQYFREGGSEKHLRDIGQMIRISGDRVDWPALRGLIDQDGLQPQWKRVEGSGAF